MEFRTLTQDEYDRSLRSILADTEGLHPAVQDVGDGKATIGWGYTLNRHNNVEIWERSGISLTAEQLETLRQVDRARAGDKTAVAQSFDRVLDAAEADQLFRASIHEYEAPAIGAGMPLSTERVAVVSVTYNRGVGALTGHPLLTAVENGDRAEAWYQMRYNCWGSRVSAEGGLRKRRFAEAEIFGLYDDPANVSIEEAAAVYGMYRTRFVAIDDVERRFGVTVEDVAAQPNRIAHANRDYPAIVAAYGEVRTIAESLGPARTALVDHLRRGYPDHASELTEARFNAAQIELERFPLGVGTFDAVAAHPARPWVPTREPAGNEARGAMNAPFQSPALNAAVAALGMGNAAAADRILRNFVDSPRGQAFVHSGAEELLAREQEAREVPAR